MPLPESCGIAFKEWTSVCDALLAGRQTIILRKGGINEAAAAGVFAPDHSEFWLYPTWVHQAEQGVRECSTKDSAHRAPADGSVLIRGMVQVDFLGYIESEDALPDLEKHHILTAETVLKRFHYRKPGLWVLGARVWRHQPGYSITVTPEHAGCKTWVELEEPLATRGLVPVLSDSQWAVGRTALQATLGAASS
jgi:hypothetical protein